MPSVASSTGFELRLQTNVSKENSYTLNYETGKTLYPTATPPTNVPLSITSQQIVGHCCPFLISYPSASGATGLRATATTAASTYKIMYWMVKCNRSSN